MWKTLNVFKIIGIKSDDINFKFNTFVLTEQTEQTTVYRGTVVKSQSSHCEFFFQTILWDIKSRCFQIRQFKSNVQWYFIKTPIVFIISIGFSSWHTIKKSIKLQIYILASFFHCFFKRTWSLLIRTSIFFKLKNCIS